MSDYEIYIFFLCFIVFSLLVAIFSYMLTIIVKQYFKTLHAGLEDENIKIEYEFSLQQSKKKKLSGCLVSFVVGILFLIFFAFSLFVNVQEDVFFDDIPTLKMVNSGSMSKKNAKNVYLYSNKLNNQIQTFDLILVYKTPKEDDLKVYDIVLYEVDETYVVHRIVGIEEPNKEHPTERYFLCQGDANENPDRFPVYYSQIKAIYKEQRIPFIGSFVSFMQSPAGWLCMLLVIFAVFGMPALEKKITKEQMARLTEIGYFDSEDKGDLISASQTMEVE